MSIRNSPNRKISGWVKPGWEISGQLSKEQSNKEESNKDYPDILSINQADTIDRIRIYRSIIYENIDYEILREQLDRSSITWFSGKQKRTRFQCFHIS